ncbi:MAG TPA: tyrosine--tRNA ligase [Firmicutes bacterium]|nr:tyrosine--tRNA ligase [Bacillota bacterium]
MTNAFDVLAERGAVAQVSHPEELVELLEREKVTFYVGFDATAPSLHVGHFTALMAMARLQRFGHRPIALIGGGTTMVGDPTGRTEMRPMLTREQIIANTIPIRKQLERFLDFSDGRAIMVDNAEWLLELKYVELLREIGVHFSVNRMLTAECFRNRMEKGLSFLEFNYMLMQAYDFLELYRRYGCRLQIGGDDQWSNILAGVDLIRRKEKTPAFALTLTLLTTASGKKMGKTEAGAIWLDPEMTSPYEFYQYFRNIDDADVPQRLALLTDLPMSEVHALSRLKDKEVNEAKKVLAYEVTRLVHGPEEAEKARRTAESLFAGKDKENGDTAAMPTTYVQKEEVAGGLRLLDLLVKTKLAASTSEGRRLIDQGGITVNGAKVDNIQYNIDISSFREGRLEIRKGKKVYHQVICV